jgi:hypothetical protein
MIEIEIVVEIDPQGGGMMIAIGIGVIQDGGNENIGVDKIYPI